MITIPRLWDGGTCWIVGGGPSLSRVDLTKIHRKRIIGCNSAFTLGDWVDVCWSVDGRFIDWNVERLAQFPGLKLSCCDRLKVPPGIRLVARSRKLQGIETDPAQISWNKNCGGSAINLAYHFGVKRIFLIGFDMQVSADGMHNWHKFHKSAPRSDVYVSRFIPAMEQIAKDAARLGLEIYNATPGSALTCFPLVNYEEAAAC